MKPISPRERLQIPQLLPVQEAAVAKLIYATERPGAVAVLCGPPGVGKTLVLDAMARAAEAVGHSCRIVSVTDGVTLRAGGWPRVLLVDDCDDADAETLAALLFETGAEARTSSVILSGSGRLLTLISRDSRLENAVRLRAVLTPSSRSETCRLVTAVLGTRMPSDPALASSVGDAIHEISGGIPASVVRLAELAAVVAVADGAAPLTSDTIERIHARLAVTAA